jgi:LPS sulfotransferase NodH
MKPEDVTPTENRPHAVQKEIVSALRQTSQDITDEQMLVSRINGLVVDPQVAAHAIATSAAADRCALVFFTPRSGSSWLTKIVAATNSLGFLEEYINPDFILDVAKQMHASDPATLLAMLKRWAKTENGVFTMELRAVDVELFDERAFFDAFGAGTLVFFLWRDNIVAQGISLYRAIATNRYHSTDAPTAAPAYDADQIAEWMRHIVEIENKNLTLLQRRGLHARFLRYEDIIRDRATTLAMFADAVHVKLTEKQLSASRDGELHKIADQWNHGAEQRFRAERRDFIWDLEAQRLIRQGP